MSGFITLPYLVREPRLFTPPGSRYELVYVTRKNESVLFFWLKCREEPACYVESMCLSVFACVDRSL